MTEIKINALRNFSFGYRLQRLRWWNGLTQKEFAELIGCSQSSVSMWEHGNCIPYGNILEKIIMLYELPYDFFDDIERS